MPRVRPLDLPADAVKRSESVVPAGQRAAYFFVDNVQVAYRQWDEEGALVKHISYRGDKRHGAEISWWENGMVSSETFWVDGREHGTARQYDWDGNLIGWYQMDHGTGADLWYSEAGVLAEERYYVDGLQQGFERWWNCSSETVHEEKHYHNWSAHGVFRRWNEAGRLRRGYPKYFVNGEQVTKRQYLSASKRDPTLPPFREADNDPHRSLPPGVLKAGDLK